MERAIKVGGICVADDILRNVERNKSFGSDSAEKERY
jgi:hypothetical protein